MVDNWNHMIGWLSICVFIKHCLHETGALLAWDWCIACMRLVHCLHETGALSVWDWCIACTRLMPCLPQTGAMFASEMFTSIVCFLYFLVQQTDIWIDKWNWCLPAWRITAEQIWFRRGWVEPLWRSSWGRARPGRSRSVPSLGSHQIVEGSSRGYPNEGWSVRSRINTFCQLLSCWRERATDEIIQIKGVDMKTRLCSKNTKFKIFESFLWTMFVVHIENVSTRNISNFTKINFDKK